MKVFFVVLSFATVSLAFLPSAPDGCRVTELKAAYVPDGLTPDQWRKMKSKEQQAHSQKRFGAFGPQSFKSRSLRAFQEDLEKGKAGHLVPMFNAKEKMKAGTIKKQDIPYMQRGGSWDNSDVSGAKKKSWSSADKKYIQNGTPARADWLGTVERAGSQPKGKTQSAAPQKKLFGFF